MNSTQVGAPLPLPTIYHTEQTPPLKNELFPKVKWATVRILALKDNLRYSVPPLKSDQ